MVTVSKQVIKGMNEGNLKWETLSRNQDVLNNSIARADGLYNTDCSLAPLLVFLNDHKAETLDRAVAAVQAFAAENDKDDLQFQLAAGNAGIEAATNEVIKQSELIILVLVYICVAAMCMITFRSFAATLCIVLPLILTSVLGNALMAALGIGVKVATPAGDRPRRRHRGGLRDLHLHPAWSLFLRMGLPLQEAYYETLRSTGKAVLFTGLCLGDRRGHLDLLGDQVPGRHGPDADLHAALEHVRRPLAAAGPGAFPDQPGQAAGQEGLAVRSTESRRAPPRPRPRPRFFLCGGRPSRFSPAWRGTAARSGSAARRCCNAGASRSSGTGAGPGRGPGHNRTPSTPPCPGPHRWGC
ncbi:putative export protein [Pseudomonas aeruginosa]|nr:putative export protein [Pseudomonas aeruginosa]